MERDMLPQEVKHYSMVQVLKNTVKWQQEKIFNSEGILPLLSLRFGGKWEFVFKHNSTLHFNYPQVQIDSNRIIPIIKNTKT